MSTPLNPLTHPLSQIRSFSPHFEDNPLPIDTGGNGLLPTGNDGGGGGDSGGGSGPTLTGTPLGNIGAGVKAVGSALTSTVSTSILTYLFTSRVVLFLIGMILIIAGLYMLKPGPVTNVLTAPIRAAKGAIKTGTEIAATTA
jgi:hypothetical protein